MRKGNTMASSFNITSSRVADGDLLSSIGHAVSSVFRRFGSRTVSTVGDVSALIPPSKELKLQASSFMAKHAPNVESGFARVWLVKEMVERQGGFAIKAARKANPKTPSQDVMQQELYREALALQSLKSPYIVEIVGAWQDSALGVVLLQNLMDGSLIELSQTKSGISIAMIHQIGCETSAGLHYMHEHGFVHGDFHEGNILYQQTLEGVFRFQINDFGRCVKKGGRCAGSNNAYMPPEVSSHWRRIFPSHFVSNPEAHPANDVWAFGAMMICLLTIMSPREEEGWLRHLGKVSIGESPETEEACFGRLANIAMREQKKVKSNTALNLKEGIPDSFSTLSGCQCVRMEKRPSMEVIHDRLKAISLQK